MEELRALKIILATLEGLEDNAARYRVLKNCRDLFTGEARREQAGLEKAHNACLPTRPRKPIRLPELPM